MAKRRCPECGLINPGSTRQCDCGWSFITETLSEQARERRSRIYRAGKISLRMGALLAGYGLTSLFVTITGDSAIWSFGALTIGLIVAVRGARLMKGNRVPPAERVYSGVPLPAARVLPRKSQ